MTIRPGPPKITLDRVRPTVVRRRVFDGAPGQGPSGAGAGFTDDDDDESGPPSSVNVARALASLRGHELRRLDEILTHDDEVAPPPPPPEPVVPTVGVGASIALPELARRISVTQEELVTALVTRGFFDVSVKAILPRETARTAASMFGWTVQDTDEAPPAALDKPRAAKAAPKAAGTKAKAKTSAKTKAKRAVKPARRTSRRA